MSIQSNVKLNIPSYVSKKEGCRCTIILINGLGSNRTNTMKHGLFNNILVNIRQEDHQEEDALIFADFVLPNVADDAETGTDAINRLFTKIKRRTQIIQGSPFTYASLFSNRLKNRVKRRAWCQNHQNNTLFQSDNGMLDIFVQCDHISSL